MPAVGLFGQVIAAVQRSAPPDIDLIAVELHRTDDRLRVDLVTSETGRLIGRRGTTADAIRLAIAQAVHIPVSEVHLNISEPKSPPPPQWPPYDPGDEPPADEPPSGVREPRDPRPGATPPASANPEPAP